MYGINYVLLNPQNKLIYLHDLSHGVNTSYLSIENQISHVIGNILFL